MDENRLIDMDGFGQRLREAIAPEKPTNFAERAGVAQPTLFKYLRPPANFSPSLEIVAKIAAAANTTIDYLATGNGTPPSPNDNVVWVPRFDATLAAGAGKWNEGRRKIEDVPLSRTFVTELLGRRSASGLAFVESRGDSMEPTIQDRSSVLLDENDKTLIDAVFAFVLDGEARMKRFRKNVTGLTIISDNPSYPPETLEGADLKRIMIIGRVLWSGHLH